MRFGADNSKGTRRKYQQGIEQRGKYINILIFFEATSIFMQFNAVIDWHAYLSL